MLFILIPCWSSNQCSACVHVRAYVLNQMYVLPEVQPSYQLSLHWAKKRPWRWHFLIIPAVSSLWRPAGAWAWSTCATRTRPPGSLTVSFATSGCTTSTTGWGRRITTGRTWGSQVTVNWPFGLKRNQTIIILQTARSKVSMRLKHQI